jgi:hypothetical protein
MRTRDVFYMRRNARPPQAPEGERQEEDVMGERLEERIRRAMAKGSSPLVVPWDDAKLVAAAARAYFLSVLPAGDYCWDGVCGNNTGKINACSFHEGYNKAISDVCERISGS